MKDEDLEGRKSTKDLIFGLLIALVAIAGGLLIISAPVEDLLGESIYGFWSAFHGIFAGVFMVTATIGLYQAFRLWIGTTFNVRELEVGSLLNAAACLLTVILGNWIYIAYRGPGGPGQYFLEKAPEIHSIFFEFKGFAAIFTVPLAVGAAYLICRYANRLMENTELREAVALLLILNFFYFITAFGLGAAITKLMPV